MPINKRVYIIFDIPKTVVIDAQAGIQPIAISMRYKEGGTSLPRGDGVLRNIPAIFNFSSIELFASNAF